MRTHSRSMQLLSRVARASLLLAASASPLAAQPQAAQARVEQPPAQDARPQFPHVRLTAGRSTVVNTDFDVTRIAITNPAIADAVVVAPREILIDGKAPGTVSLIVWGGGSRLQYDLIVEQPVTTLEQHLRTLFPGEDITVSTNEGATIATHLALTDVLPRLAGFVSAFASQGSVTQDQSGVSFALGTLSNASAATISLVVSPSLAGLNLNSISLTADQLDQSNSITSSLVYNWIKFSPAAQLIDEVNLPVADFAYDVASGRIYASVVDQGGPWSNSVVSIDAVTGGLVSSS